jgi:predicted O-methyltransferase YrrM
MNTVLEQRYRDLCADQTSDIWLHLPRFVAAVEELQATKVIELGTRYGVSTIAWLYGLQNRGHLWAVDCSFPVAAPGSDTNLLDTQGPLGCLDFFTFILGYDSWQAVLDALPTEVDIVFVDTMHTFEQTTLELELYYPRVRPGGRMYFHDTALEVTGNATTTQPLFPVRTAVQQFCSALGLEWDDDQRCSGLGCVYC